MTAKEFLLSKGITQGNRILTAYEAEVLLEGFAMIKLSEAGILTGEDSKRFNEAMNNPVKAPKEEVERMKVSFNKIMSKATIPTYELPNYKINKDS